MMDQEGKCPKCGAVVPDDAPEGLCPRCLGALNLEPETVVSGEEAATWTPPPASELAPLFPQLELLDLIGRGGMGAVYKARQKELDRIIALKILPPGIGSQPAFAERFAREAKALAKLSHPGIVTVFDFGRADGLYFFLMEFVDGVSLRQLLAGGRMAAREALAIVPEICDALQYAHDQGIVHRDIKPENVLLDRRGRVKVADFGLAKLAGTAEEPPAGAGAPAGLPPLTEANKVMGTPLYMAPEQVEHPEAVDHRADIYALGVVFYQMLTGELPSKPLQPPSRKVRIDVRLDEVVLQALERKPERRYQQASQIKTALETLASEPSFRHPTPGVRATSEQELAPEAVSVKGWLRLAGAGLLLVFGAGLVISIFLAGNAAAEKRRRTRCQANLRQIATALQLYANDYGGRLPDCTANNPRFYGAVWPWDMHTNLVADLEQRGAQRRFLYCPSNPEMNDDRHWNFPHFSRAQTRVLGYAFLFPGCRDVPTELWRFDLKGDGTRRPEEVELAADATVSQQWDYAQIKGVWVDRSNHLNRNRPAGGNVLFEDGHASWRPFEKMKHQIIGQVVWDF